ncbi:hypothetical protein [Brachybacterium massiliense]|uniref:hypothetical protein n=1 Tax=Brachybacterium massiliense TaxID=1755098 RepID=UPI000B3BC575|nr:hypothetical protein [Brachybacterium massiliense]
MTTSTMYLFTGETNVRTTRRERYGHSGAKRYESAAVAVTVLAADQAAAERIAGAMLSTPDDTPGGAFSHHVDTHTRCFTWTRVEPAPAGIAEAEQLRQELVQTVALLDEARSDLRVSERQASDERERGEYTQQRITDVYALHSPAGSPPVCQHCQGSQGGHPPFPCPTIRALEGDA